MIIAISYYGTFINSLDCFIFKKMNGLLQLIQNEKKFVLELFPNELSLNSENKSFPLKWVTQ